MHAGQCPPEPSQSMLYADFGLQCALGLGKEYDWIATTIFSLVWSGF
jgi:hypothetical protein